MYQKDSFRENIVTHSLNIVGMDHICQAVGVRDCLADSVGIIEMNCDWTKSRLTITYDLDKIRLEEIEETLTSVGCPLKEGILSRVRHDLAHFIEQNEVNNLAYQPHTWTESYPATGLS